MRSISSLSYLTDQHLDESHQITHLKNEKKEWNKYTGQIMKAGGSILHWDNLTASNQYMGWDILYLTVCLDILDQN